MSNQENGGPAFPKGVIAFPPREGELNKRPEILGSGMTLRDYFAGTVDIPWNQAFERAFDKKRATNSLEPVGAHEVIAARAELRFMEADAMLKAREA